MDVMVERAKELGASNAAIIAVKDMTFRREFREACAVNSCGQYGTCWTCPPDVGDIDECMARAQSWKYILVYQTIGELEDSYDFEGMIAAGEVHNTLARRLDAEFRARADGLHLAAGACKLCEVCARRTDEPCRFPDQALASLESYGVAVSDLAKAAELKYINGENTVTYFGGYFYG